MMGYNRILGTLLFTLAFSLFTQANTEGLVFLGQRQVKFRAERDVIHVTGVKGKFTRIKLSVHNSGVEIINVRVHFGNGEKQNVAMRNFIPKGGYTRNIDLPGGARIIKKVAFIYKTRKKGKGRAIVKLWGVRTTGATKRVVPVAKKWNLLGQRWVKFRAERDVIVVARSQGSFTKIKLSVHNSGVKILNLRLWYGNGGKQDVAVRNFIPQGGYTRNIDLIGGARVIKKVVLFYRTPAKGKGKAMVKLWGRK